ncbi:hypothetical protein PVAP13_6NG254364 [Panicum virgatum]|uniref:Uncharacterized protein n=1 Tax=Panicum virgatum TaxID=38727 RepID=A0A8T0R1N8_PANVG|nr:hypothetical protein PVAP13_6NG254364 [Panicum virgatum]
MEIGDDCTGTSALLCFPLFPFLIQWRSETDEAERACKRRIDSLVGRQWVFFDIQVCSFLASDNPDYM